MPTPKRKSAGYTPVQMKRLKSFIPRVRKMLGSDANLWAAARRALDEAEHLAKSGDGPGAAERVKAALAAIGPEWDAAFGEGHFR